MRLLSILDHHHQLLPGQKPAEPGQGRIRLFQNHGYLHMPLHILRLREHGFHQLGLRRQRHFHVSISKPQTSALHIPSVLKATNGGLGVSNAEEFNVAVHGLAGGPLHGDVNGATQVRSDDFGVSAKERKDLLLGDRVRYLLESQRNEEMNVNIPVNAKDWKIAEKWNVGNWELGKAGIS